MLTGFDKYNEDMERFEGSQLFKRCFVQLIYYLTRHQDKRFKSKEIEGKYEIAGSEVRKLVNHARRKGIPIMSSSKGYGMATNYQEIQDTIKHLEERAREIFFVAGKLKKTFPDDVQMGMRGVA